MDVGFWFAVAARMMLASKKLKRNFFSWITVFASICLAGISMMGCEQRPQEDDPDLVSKQGTTRPDGYTRVKGFARFGSQCNYGTFAPPQPFQLVLKQCEIDTGSVELAEPLRPFILQADCKKKTMDIRTGLRSGISDTWEIMPDGSFSFAVDGGDAIFESIGSLHARCYSPLLAELWGKIDCKDRDRVSITVQARWFLDTEYEEPEVGPSPLPSAVPSGSPSPVPLPSVSPSPEPTGRHHRGRHRHYSGRRVHLVPNAELIMESLEMNQHVMRHHPDLPRCKLPEDCFFQTMLRIDQCS